MHMLMEDRPARPIPHQNPMDERSLCFEADPNANFVIDVDGRLRHSNAAGRAMLFDGLLHLDGDQRLSLKNSAGGRGHGQGAIPLRPIANMQVRQVARAKWLAVTVRAVPGAPDILHVRARAIRLDGEIDLRLVIEELGISESEAPVLQGLAQAICPKEISRTLDLSIHTIRSHIRSIYAKLGVHSAAEAQLRVLQVYYVVKSIS